MAVWNNNYRVRGDQAGALIAAAAKTRTDTQYGSQLVQRQEGRTEKEEKKGANRRGIPSRRRRAALRCIIQRVADVNLSMNVNAAPASTCVTNICGHMCIIQHALSSECERYVRRSQAAMAASRGAKPPLFVSTRPQYLRISESWSPLCSFCHFSYFMYFLCWIPTK